MSPVGCLFIVIELYLEMNSRCAYDRHLSHNFYVARYNRDVWRGSYSEVHGAFTIP